MNVLNNVEDHIIPPKYQTKFDSLLIIIPYKLKSIIHKLGILCYKAVIII